ncbi:MAG: DUF4175 family protein [Pseudohongiellaceae bacterium]
MSSTTFESLRETLKTLRRRRRNLLLLKYGGFFIIATAAAVLSVLLVASWIQPGRAGSIFLFLGLIALVLGTGYLLFRSVNKQSTDDRKLAHYVEDHIPDLEQRLLTSLEFSEEELKTGRKGVSQQFIQQLWLDAQVHVTHQQEQVETVAPASASWYSFIGAAAAASFVLVLLATSEGLYTAAERLLWPFAIEEPVAVVEIRPEIEISVEPGSIDMQRGESVTIIAKVVNAIPGTINLRLQNDNVNWRDVTMNLDGSGSESGTYSYFIPAVEEDTTYYVNFDEGGEQSSQQYQITLFDLPKVEQIDLDFDFPEYTLLEDYVDENSGDMVVPEGTIVDFQVTFNKPVREALVVFDSAYSADNEAEAVSIAPYENVQLTMTDSLTGQGQFTVTQDGVYRITAEDFDELETLNPLDYFIRSIEDTPPELALQRPGQDQEVMPLEEVVIQVAASDDYGLSQFSLNYSVVGSDEVAVDFLPEEQAKEISGNELIYLEDLAVEPGDFVSYYLTLADNNGLEGPATVVSDIYFLQVIPTDQEFRRSQGGSGGQGAGGGQGDGDSSALVSVQKDIIAATWKLKNRQGQVSQEEFDGDAEIIAESQREATDRALKSIERLAERLNFSDDTYDNAVENLSLAIEQMNLAAGDLDIQQITSALKPEQIALQYILKAEANINRTDISMQQSGGGGGAGSAQQEREDLRELFEMEMGQLENRYETPESRSGGGSPESAAEADKLEELARRQEGLTRAQRNLARREEQMTEEQKRRELERLRRQQEQLSQEVSQLAQQMSRGQQSPQNQRSQQQSQQAGQQSQSAQAQSSGSPSGGQQTPLQRAAQQMQQASESETAAIAAARSQKALENLREQQREMGGESERSVNQLAQNLGQRGQQLLQQQRALQEALQDKIRQQGLGQTRQETRADADLQGLVEAQQQQQRNLDEIEDMLRAIIARGDSEDQRLMSQAQAATRELRPIKEEMQTSNRVLRNGMVNLSVDIEQELQTPMEDLAQSLLALNPATGESSSDRIQTAAGDAEALREEIEELQQQVEAFSGQAQGEDAGQAGEGAPSVREMRQQLQRSQQLAQQLSQQVQESQAAERGQQGGRSQIGGRGNQQQTSGVGEAQTEANNSALGNARAIRQQLSQQGIEDFLNQPELFRQLLQPIIELEGALRAQAELDNINNKLYATVDEDIPEEYRELVEEYYKVLSENQGSTNSRAGSVNQ